MLKGQQWIGPGLGVLVLFAFLLSPPVGPLTELGMRTLGVFLFTVIWWVTVDLGFSSFLCLALLALTEITTPKELFATSMGSWLVLFLIGCFGLTETIKLSGFSHRFALWFLTRPFATGHPWLLLALFLFGVTIMGAIMSSAVTTILFMSLAVPMLEAAGYKKGDRFSAMFIMGISWAATASFVMTPIGHGSNLILMDWVRRDMGYNINFPLWLVTGIPMGLLTYLILLAFFRYVVRPDISKFTAMAGDYIRNEAGKLGPVKTEEKIALGVFFLVVVTWILAGVEIPGVSAYLDRIGFAIPALVGAGLLCLIRVKGWPLLTFSQWMTGVEWGTIALVAAIMAIGPALGNPETGIPELLTDMINPLVTGAPFFALVLVSMFWVILQTNIMSNLVSATLVYTIVMPAVMAADVGNPVALGFIIFAGSHYAFSLPSATASTAIVAGSGWVPVKFMARYGVLLILPLPLLFSFVFYPLVSFIYR